MEDTEKAYQKSLDYLYSFVDYSLTKAFRYSPEKFNLSRMVDLMAYLGNPQSNYKIIHVAGTKGKGSCSAMIASVLIAAGYKVGFILHRTCMITMKEFKSIINQFLIKN